MRTEVLRRDRTLKWPDEAWSDFVKEVQALLFELGLFDRPTAAGAAKFGLNAAQVAKVDMLLSFADRLTNTPEKQAQRRRRVDEFLKNTGGAALSVEQEEFTESELERGQRKARAAAHFKKSLAEIYSPAQLRELADLDARLERCYEKDKRRSDPGFIQLYRKHVEEMEKRLGITPKSS